MNYFSLHNLSFLKDKELDLVYLFIALHSVSTGISSIFIPIFLWDSGYTLSQIFLFFAILSATFVMATPSMIMFARGKSYRTLTLISAPFYAFTLFGLSALHSAPWLFFILPITLGIYKLIFDTAYQLNFAYAADEGTIGRQVGVQYIIIGAAQAVTPLVGASIAFLFGFQYLFLSSVVLILLALIPLWYVDAKPVSFSCSVQEMTSILTSSKNRIFNCIHTGYGALYAIHFVAWPVFLFVVVGGLEVFGAILSVASLATMFMQYLDGLAVDNGKRKIVTTLSTATYALSGVIQAVVAVFPTTLAATLVHIMQKSANGLMLVPFGQENTHRTKSSTHPAVFIFSYMFVWHIARFSAFALLACAAYFLSIQIFFTLTFLLGAAGTTIYFLLNKLQQ